MKKLLIATSALMIALSGFAQGTLEFKNRNTGAGVDAKVSLMDPLGADLGVLDSGYVAQLWAGPDAASLAPVTAPVPFRDGAGAGYWNPGAETPAVVGSVAPGAVAFVDVAAWDANYATLGDALAAGAAAGTYSGVAGNALLEIATGGAGSPPSLESPLAGLQAFSISAVPEPSTIALALLGAAALFLRRGNK